MMASGDRFKEYFWSEYVYPQSVSVWGSSSREQGLSLDSLLRTSVEAMKSDLYRTEWVEMGGMVQGCAEDIFAVVNARLSYVPIAGNTSVRVQLDRGLHQLRTMCFPCRVRCRRYLRLSDIDDLVGAELQFMLNYVLWKASWKELSILRSVTLEADNGTTNLDALATFSESCKATYESMREDIMMYTGGI